MMRMRNSGYLVLDKTNNILAWLIIVTLTLCSTSLLSGCDSNDIIVTLIAENGTVHYKVPTRTKILSVNYSNFENIYGLEQLPRLNTLKINFTNTFSDYQFLKQLSIKRIVLTNALIESLHFITGTPSLEIVYIESCIINEPEPIDVSSHPRLQLLDIEKCQLSEFPLSGYLPRTLEYIWLMRNNITKVEPEMIMQLVKLKSVSFKYNPIAVDLYQNALLSRITQDRPANDELPTDLKRFFSNWWESDYVIQGNKQP